MTFRSRLTIVALMIAGALFAACGSGGGAAPGDAEAAEEGYDPHSSPENLAHAVFDLYASGKQLDCYSDLYLSDKVVDEIFGPGTDICKNLLTAARRPNFTVINSAASWVGASIDDQGDNISNPSPIADQVLPWVQISGSYMMDGVESGFPIDRAVKYLGKWYVLKLNLD